MTKSQLSSLIELVISIIIILVLILAFGGLIQIIFTQ